MKGLLLFLSAGWALISMARYEPPCSPVVWYCLCQVLIAVLFEFVLVQYPGDYFGVYVLGILPTALAAGWVGWQATATLKPILRWMARIQPLLFASFGVWWVAAQIAAAYRRIPREFLIILLQAWVLFSVGCCTLVALQVHSGYPARLYAALGVLWLAQAVFYFCFALRIPYNYDLWARLADWVPAVISVTGHSWAALSVGRKT